MKTTWKIPSWILIFLFNIWKYCLDLSFKAPYWNGLWPSYGGYNPEKLNPQYHDYLSVPTCIFQCLLFIFIFSFILFLSERSFWLWNKINFAFNVLLLMDRNLSSSEIINYERCWLRIQFPMSKTCLRLHSSHWIVDPLTLPFISNRSSYADPASYNDFLKLKLSTMRIL